PISDPMSAPMATCDNSAPISATKIWSASKWIVTNRFSLDSGTRCADITVYKPNGAGISYIFSQGYNVSCATVSSPAGARLVARGLNVQY
ncbi:MAG: hypothetical protein Q8L30_01995, partial [bacterium]|nr:hypothetical protein [bacterium]